MFYNCIVEATTSNEKRLTVAAFSACEQCWRQGSKWTPLVKAEIRGRVYVVSQARRR